MAFVVFCALSLRCIRHEIASRSHELRAMNTFLDVALVHFSWVAQIYVWGWEHRDNSVIFPLKCNYFYSVAPSGEQIKLYISSLVVLIDELSSLNGYSCFNLLLILREENCTFYFTFWHNFEIETKCINICKLHVLDMLFYEFSDIIPPSHSTPFTLNSH